MLSKFVFVLGLFELVVGNALPVWSGNPYNSELFLRNAIPNVAIGFGSGFSSNIGGIRHSSGFGSSFQSGNAEAYGAGFASADGTARGIGYANAAPQYAITPIANYQHAAPNHYINSIPTYQYTAPNHYINSVPNYQQVPAVSSGHGHSSSLAQNHGNFGNSVSSVQSHNGGTSLSAANNNLGHQSAVSAVQNPRGHGSSFAATNSYRSPSGRTGLNYEEALTSSQNIGGYNINTSQSVQQHPGSLQKSGATHIEGPGIQVSQAHAINTGYYK